MHSEKSQARSMLFYSRNCWQQNWVRFVLYIKSDCVYLWLQLWLKNRCKNTDYYYIFQKSLLLHLNNYQHNCNNTISSMSVAIIEWYLCKVKPITYWECPSVYRIMFYWSLYVTMFNGTRGYSIFTCGDIHMVEGTKPYPYLMRGYKIQPFLIRVATKSFLEV